MTPSQFASSHWSATPLSSAAREGRAILITDLIAASASCRARSPSGYWVGRREALRPCRGDLGFAPHIVSVVLGHAHIADGATAIYARSRYQQEHRQALQALADEVDRLIAGDGSVIRLAACR
jgi:hypothetical protein